VGRIDENDLVVLVYTVLVNPVRVEHTQVSATTSNTLLSGAPQAALELEVVDTLADGLAVGCTCRKSNKIGIIMMASTGIH
jgi:hypothetical protein